LVNLQFKAKPQDNTITSIRSR